jgi:hypothetical protein
MKKIILNFNLFDNFQFWVYFSSIANNLKLSTVRTSLYKLSKNKLLTKNTYLNSILSNCYLKTGNYNLSVKFLNKLEEEGAYKDPICYFIMSLNFIFNSMSRKNKFKEETFLKGSNLLNKYQLMRNRENPLEVLYNIGRFNQFIGHDREALKFYNLFCYKIGNYMMNEIKKEKIQNSMLYNYAILLKKSGNEIEAHKTILDNIVI